MRIALVVMPWVSARYPLLGVATLKGYLEAHGVAVDVHHLNFKLAARLGSLYGALAEQAFVWPEWLFSYHLFGPGGSHELPHEFDDVVADASVQTFLRQSSADPERLRSLLHDEIPAFLDECLEAAPWGEYDLIGFSSFMSSHAACLAFSKRLKERFPGTPVVLGGCNVQTEMGRETLKGCEWIDWVVDGEGEAELLSLVDALERGEPPARGSLRRAEPTAMDSLPTPNHDDYFAQLDDYGLRSWITPIATFEASRGCWWGEKQHCTFCGLNGQEMKYRARPAEHVVRDILDLYRRHHVDLLYANDNILGVEHMKSLVPKLAQLRKENGYDWQIFFEIKSNLKLEQLEALAAAGITDLQPGIEALSTPALKLMRKGVSAIQNIQALKLSMDCGIAIHWNLLVGFPGEDPADRVRRDVDAATSLGHLHPPAITRVRPDRFSPYQMTPEAFGAPVMADPVYRFIYPEPRFERRRIAYYFDFDFAAAGAPPAESLYAPIAELVGRWRREWTSTVFAFRQGAGYVQLFDSRPLDGRAGELRIHALHGLEAALFTACRSIKTAAQAAAACDAPVSDAERLLDRMVEKRWLHREDGQYLSLAIRYARLIAPQRWKLDQMLALRRQLLRPAAPARKAERP
jgi:ribosomal peptide maturation radical SAM protein 1